MSKTINIKILGLALFAVFAFSAFTAASAFAVNEWLFNGSVFTGELSTNTESELTLNFLSGTGGLLNTVDCSGLFEGTVTGGGPIALASDLFSLTGVLIEELEPSVGMEGKSLTCETLVDHEACKVSTETGSEMLLWVDELSLPLSLRWELLIELMATPPVFLLHFHHVAFEFLCILFNLLHLQGLCEGVTSGALTNITGGVLLEFGEGSPIESEALLCENVVEGTITEMTEADLVGNLVILHSNGGTLSVS